MISTGLSLNFDGACIELQLSESLQVINAKHCKHVNNALVDPKNFQAESKDGENENADDGIREE